MYQDTVTIFNRRQSPEGGILWYPKTLQGVDLNVDHAALVAKYGQSCNDRAVLHVKYDWHDGPVVAGVSYLTPMLWQAADPAAAITFTAGDDDDFDFFIEGAWPDSAPIADEQWPGGVFDHLVRSRDGVYAISSVAQYSVIPHFEITGR